MSTAIAGGITHSLFKLLDILECNLEGEGGGYLQIYPNKINNLTIVRYHPYSLASHTLPLPTKGVACETNHPW